MRSQLRAVVIGGVIVVAAAMGGSPASGQRVIRGPILQPVPQPKLPDMSVDGTLEDMRSGVLQVLSGTGQTWLVQVAPSATVRVKGKAAADYLAANQTIAILADVDVKRSRIEGPVGKTPGLQPDSGLAPWGVPSGRPGKRDL
jgi:hypothetical protein